MSLQVLFIFLMYSSKLLCAVSDGSEATPDDRAQLASLPVIKLIKNAPLHLREDLTPCTLQDTERNILFHPKALQKFSDKKQLVYVHFEVKKDQDHLYRCSFDCTIPPHNKPFVTLRLASKQGSFMRKLTVYEAVRIGFLRGIRAGAVQKEPFCCPELGKTVAAIVRHQELDDQELNDDLPAWKDGNTQPHLVYVATNAKKWVHGIVRITVGGTALTGSFPEAIEPQVDNDGSAFFAAIEQIQLLYG